MVSTHFLPLDAWLALTRLGEAQLLLPPMLLACAWLAWRGQGRALACWWLGGTALGTLLTTASKVAFIGYGLGHAGLDFTGISGHSMFAAAVLPPLLRLGEAAWRTPASPAAGRTPAAQKARTPQAAEQAWRGWGTVAGVLLALLVGVSRVAVQAHSWSEVIAGLALGGADSGCALALARVPTALPLWRGLPWLGAAVLALAVDVAPPAQTHDWVTRLALATSGRLAPYLRRDLHRPTPAALPATAPLSQPRA